MCATGAPSPSAEAVDFVDHDAVRLRDERYLCGLTPSAYFPLWLGVGIALGAALEDAAVMGAMLVLGPTSWSMPFYMARMPVFSRRRRSDVRSDERQVSRGEQRRCAP